MERMTMMKRLSLTTAFAALGVAVLLAQAPTRHDDPDKMVQDGKFLIKKREGAATPNVMTWTEHAAIKKADASGKMTNALSIEVSADKVRFLVNGTEVASQPKTQIDPNGVAGLRINHNLNVQ